jgi:ATP/maltotriose-dependent transcriptional regulator MalT
VSVASAARKAEVERGAEVARSLGWPADRVGFVGALGGFFDIGAQMRRPRSMAVLILSRRAKQASDIKASLRARQRAFPEVDLVLRDARLSDSMADDLTPSEHHIVELLHQQLTTQEIAETLVISQTTVRRHISNILRKLRISARPDLPRTLSAGDEIEDAAERAGTPQRHP